MRAAPEPPAAVIGAVLAAHGTKAPPGAARLSGFRVPGSRTGRFATFEGFKPLFAGEPYRDPGRRPAHDPVGASAGSSTLPTATTAAAVPQEGARAWRAPSPMKQSACPGDYIGCLGSPARNMPMPSPPDMQTTVAAPLPPRRNIVTGPSKRGGFGFNCTTLSERAGASGIVGEYAYIADPMRIAVRAPPAAAAPHSPFRPANPPARGGPGTSGRAMCGRPGGALGEFEWRPRPDVPSPGTASGSAGPAGRMGGSDQSGQAARSSTAHAQAAVSTAVAGGAAFKPPSAPRKGMLSTFEKYPGARLHEQRNACSSLQTVTHANEQQEADK